MGFAYSGRPLQTLWDSLALVSFQEPIYAAIQVISGANGDDTAARLARGERDHAGAGTDLRCISEFRQGSGGRPKANVAEHV
ncbi:hypothetical protein [Pseudomonas sp.]|uniref:hypothetical protein n=1 Tax=Pseudomonas sp. TaxID=306 RepID=UPI0028A6CB9E|nr:hypothetical protein [Pseudomonas sp.]